MAINSIGYNTMKTNVRGLGEAIDRYFEQIVIERLHGDRKVRILVDVERPDDPHVWCDYSLIGEEVVFIDATYVVDITPWMKYLNDGIDDIKKVTPMMDQMVASQAGELNRMCKTWNIGAVKPFVIGL